MRFFLVRHGQTEANEKGLFYGSTDLGLTRTGLAQARKIKLALKSVKFESVYCSQLRRAQQTANIILPARSRTMQFDRRLNEMHFGAWEMRHFEEIAKNDPHGWQRWLTGGQKACATGGEPFEDFAQRVTEFAEQLRATTTSGHQLIVAHQGVLSLLLARLLNMPAEAMWHFGFQHQAYSMVENHAGFITLRVFNGQVQYLPEE
ncbi:adenosylcobalamin/alpha-ribazole phosphatase [Budvicia aquatica]|uniref:adenosylcobalamin/alpha-ribazole phosphatase n=1 Tax=Budvicia aquatica TaxID=82979 RepID=UPI00208CB10E|nr:adenosylcobalamin/alpha-ribazole phosphatase [Budvicia aquatica]GKX51734.1 alpha-ribazole-5'-phosphate phosphatase [Budvicia aquatica]